MFEWHNDDEFDMFARIKIIGVGELGLKAINYALENGIDGVGLAVVDSDSKNLLKSAAPQRLKIDDITSKESKKKISNLTYDTDMFYLIGGLDREDLLLRIAEQIKNCNEVALTICQIYGSSSVDDVAIDKLKSFVDTVIINESEDLELMFQAVRGVTDLVALPGLVGLDFADVKEVTSRAGEGRVGYGEASGEEATVEAMKKAIQSLNGIIGRSKGLLINILGSSNNLSMIEINDATNFVLEAAHEDAEIIWGVTLNETLDEQIKVVILATRFTEN